MPRPASTRYRDPPDLADRSRETHSNARRIRKAAARRWLCTVPGLLGVSTCSPGPYVQSRARRMNSSRIRPHRAFTACFFSLPFSLLPDNPPPFDFISAKPVKSVDVPGHQPVAISKMTLDLLGPLRLRGAHGFTLKLFNEIGDFRVLVFEPRQPLDGLIHDRQQRRRVQPPASAGVMAFRSSRSSWAMCNSSRSSGMSHLQLFESGEVFRRDGVCCEEYQCDLVIMDSIDRLPSQQACRLEFLARQPASSRLERLSDLRPAAPAASAAPLLSLPVG